MENHVGIGVNKSRNSVITEPSVRKERTLFALNNQSPGLEPTKFGYCALIKGDSLCKV